MGKMAARWSWAAAWAAAWPWAAALAIATALAAAEAQAQPAPLNGIALRDQRAAVVQPATLKDRPVLLHFVFTGCSTTCPLQVRELAQLRRELPADVRARVRFVSVSVDPVNDTPATLAAFARRMDAELPGWHFTTGPEAQIAALVDRLQAMDTTRKPRPAPEDHRTALYLFGADGQLVQRYRGVPVDRPRLAEEMGRIARGTVSASR